MQTHYKNILACLVHEKPECIVDLIRNLRYFSPNSLIILYQGGLQSDLLEDFPFEKMGVKICPDAKPMKWGWLHNYALDCMKYALSFCTFDAFTIVDSDQLCIKKGYAEKVSQFFQKNPGLGILTNQAQKQIPPNLEDPSVQMYQEKELWEPFLASLPQGKNAFMYWCFWPSTCFAYKACRDLVKLFDESEVLKKILNTTKIWASEEVLFPTLVKALGYEIAQNPCSYKYVQYQKEYSLQDLSQAFAHPNAYWMHPVPRDIQHPIRKKILEDSQNYVHLNPVSNPIDTWFDTIVHKTVKIEGWLSIQETIALAKTTKLVLDKNPSPIIVEVGSYCGKSTCIMALTLKHFKSKGIVYAIDPFEGYVSASDDQVAKTEPTYLKFLNYVHSLGIKNYVEPIKAKSQYVKWESSIDMLFIDGLHDYYHVARDFWLFEHAVKSGGYIAFHDYADYYEGVKSLVHEALKSQKYTKASLSDSLIVLQKQLGQKDIGSAWAKPTIQAPKKYPLISCITPTYNRKKFLRRSIANFLEQDYPNKEMIILDDSPEPMSDPVLGKNPYLHYFYLQVKKNVGQKRNLACDLAKGEIIIHWDDDDWYAKDWIRRQVEALQLSQAEITGLDKIYFYKPQKQQAWEYIYPSEEKPWVYGATLAYWKRVWEKNKFSEIQMGEDNDFVWRGLHIFAHDYTQGYIGHIHAGNTSPKSHADQRWHRIDPSKLALIKEDKNFKFSR